MDRGDIISGAAFKAVVRSAAVFLLVLLMMAVISVRLIDRLMTEQVRLRVEEMAQSTGADDGPQGGLVQRIDAATRGVAGRTLAYAVFDAAGNRLAGNTAHRPAHGAWVEIRTTLELPAHVSAKPSEQSFLLHAVPVGELTLVVGRGSEYVNTARRAAIRGFALTGFVAVLAMLAIGYVLSQRNQTSLQSIGAALDRLSRQINAHLDRLDALFGQTRRTATAIAQDLRRPLARTSLGMERAMAHVEDGEDARGEIEQAPDDLVSLQAVVGSILRIARAESGDVGEMRRFDLRAVLDEVAETFQPVAEDAAQSLDYTRADRPLTVEGDAQMLAQLVVNLVQNAITHAGDGAAIALAVGPGAKGLELSVSDNGPGIPEADRDRVLEPFYRMDDARSVEGTGMSMALVRAIALRHGAALTLEDAAPGLRVRVVFADLAPRP